LERHARARGVLLEDHRQRRTFERAVVVRRALQPPATRALAAMTFIQDRAEFGFRDRRETEEMPGRAIHAPASSTGAASNASSVSIAWLICASSTISGGAKRTTLSPATPTSSLRSRSLP